MGNKLFANYGVDIAKAIDQFVAPGLIPALLIKIAPGTRTAGQLTGGTNPTQTSYACRGMIDTQGLRNQEGVLILDGTKKLLLGGDSIADSQIPEVGDRVTIESATYRIEAVDRDPDAATYSLVVRVI